MNTKDYYKTNNEFTKLMEKIQNPCAEIGTININSPVSGTIDIGPLTSSAVYGSFPENPITSKSPIFKRFIIPKGVEILVHNTASRENDKYTTATGADFICVTTVKETIFEYGDLCMFENLCELGYGMKTSHFYVDGNYYGFRLPKNDMGSKFFIIYKNWIKYDK